MVLWRRLTIALLGIAGFSAWIALPPAPVASDDTPASTQTVAVAVRNGEASFDLSTHDSHDQYLVVVSSLSRESGPYRVELTTNSIAIPRPIESVVTAPDLAWRRRNEQSRRELRDSRQRRKLTESHSSNPAPAAERTFWIMVRGDDFTLPSNYEPVRANLSETGEYCAIYVDRNCQPDDALRLLVSEVKETFDRDVYPTAVKLLGRHRDVDGDGHFAILLTPWLSHLSDNTVSLGGFVRSSDFYNEIETPLGNRCDMMYLNAELRPGPHLRTLIAHEYTHAVTLSEHVFGSYLPGRVGQEEESWLDESIAHLAENLHNYSWSNLDYRISAFLSEPERYRLVVDDYFAAGIWRGHGNRGSTYLFLRWCVDQYGVDILRDLIQTNLTGIDNVEVATGRPFRELYRDWSVAMFLNHSGLDYAPSDEMKSVDTRSELNGRLLAGPQYDSVRLDGSSLRFELVGTSSKYVIVHSPPEIASRVQLRSENAAQLQVSIRKLPSDLARLELSAVATKSPHDDQGDSVQLHVKECNGVEVTLERAAWERSTRGTNRDADRGFVSPILVKSDIAGLFGSAVIPASGVITAETLDLKSGSVAGEPIVIKVTGRDSAGHVVSAWCPVPMESLHERRALRTADSSSR